MRTISILCLIVLASCGAGNDHPAGKAISLSDTTRLANCVSFTRNEKDQPVVSWCETEKSGAKHFYMALWDTDAFGAKTEIPIEQSAGLHEEGMPKLACQPDGTIVAAYEIAAPTEANRFAGFVRYIISRDKGRSWSDPAFLHSDTTAGTSHSFAAITQLKDGSVGAVWLDEKMKGASNGRPVLFAKMDADKHFSGEHIIDSVACECCRLAIHHDQQGIISVLFRDIVNDSIRDMSIIRSTDQGEHFLPAVSFSHDNWIVNGCPHNGPAVVATNELTYATWFTGGPSSGVFYGELNSHSQVVRKDRISADGRFIQLCLLADSSRLLAFNETRKDSQGVSHRIVLQRVGKDGMKRYDVPGSGGTASYPVVAAVNNEQVVVAWSQDGKIFYSVVNVNDIQERVKQPAQFAATPIAALLPVSNEQDPVCGMKIAYQARDTVQENGRIIGFCSATCKERYRN